MPHPILLFDAFDYYVDHKQGNFHILPVRIFRKSLHLAHYDMGIVYYNGFGYD